MGRPKGQSREGQGSGGRGRKGGGGRGGRGGSRGGIGGSARRGSARGNPKFPQRWNKGQACESNPQSRKFRDQVSPGQFNLHNVLDNPLLTVRNVEQRAGDDDDMDILDEEEDDVYSEDVQSLTISEGGRTRLSSISSCKSFASGFSKCTNRAFERFMSKFKFDSALHKEMLSLLAATTEVINSMGGKQNETEYFASFISTLDKCEPQHYEPMMALVCIVIGKVPQSILQLKFPDIYPKIGQILIESMESYNHNVTRLCCEALMKILGAQNPRRFDSDQDLQKLLNLILKCALSENPKVRRKARKAISFLMSRQNEKNCTVLNKYLLGWVLDHLLSFPSCGVKAITDSLGLLHFSWPYIQTIPTSGAKKLFEAILRVMSSGDVSILKISLTVFSSVFQSSGTTSFVFSSSNSNNEEKNQKESFTPKLISALWDFRPDFRNNEAFMVWLQCILDGVVRLKQEDLSLGVNYVPLIIDAVSSTWESMFGQLTSVLLAKHLYHILNSEEISTTSSNLNMQPIIENSFRILSKHLISIPPNPHCMTTLNSLLEVLSPELFCESAKEIFLQVVPLKSNSPGIEKTLGNFVKAFGVENIWPIVNAEIRLTVLLPLLRDNLRNGEFSFWRKMILPLSANQSLTPIVWDSFVGFCRNPKNPNEFPAELLGKAIWENPLARLSALAALRQFILWPQCKPTAEKYTKNYFPVLFNTYMKEKSLGSESHPGHSDSISKTIQDYLSFCDDEFHFHLLEKTIIKFENKEGSYVLDLMALLLSDRELDGSVCRKFIEIAKSLINDAENMKRAYRILQVLVKNDEVPLEIKEEIVQILRDNKGNAKSNAEALRLESLNCLISKNEVWMKEFLPEAILNLLSVNKITRTKAVAFVKTVCVKLGEKSVDEVGKEIESLMDIIELGLKSDNSFIIASTIHFISLAIKELRPSSPNAILTQNIILGLQNQMRLMNYEDRDEQIIRESMAYLSLNLSLFKGMMGLYAKDLGELIALNVLPRKDVNKMLAQMLKIFGVAGLRSVLPNADEPKMHNRIRNLQRKLKKLKENKVKKPKGNDDHESGSDEDDEMEGLMGLGAVSVDNKKLVIKEGLVDFLDVKNVTGALINKPESATSKSKETSTFVK